MASRAAAEMMNRLGGARDPEQRLSCGASPRATTRVVAVLVLALLGALVLVLSQGGSVRTTAPARLASGRALGGAPRGAELSAARRRALAVAYGRIPLAFESNQGQSAKSVRFFSQGAGYALGLTAHGAVLALARHQAHGGSGAAAAVGLRFLGGSSDPAMVASGRLPGKVNYLIGRDPRGWHTGVPTYSRVTYRGVWSGIDVSFYGSQSRLEYDFRLAPRADPGRIALGLSGARSIRLNPRGDLVIGLRGGSVSELAPRAYQQIGKVRRAVASRYVRLSGDRVAVRVGAYDHRLPLVIDPALIYSTFLGGSAIQYTNPEIAVDSAGDVYVGGPTTSVDFPTTPGAYQRTYGGAYDGYVAKLNPAGTAFVYSTYLGGSGFDYVEGVAVDSAGDAYAVGGTASTDFPTTSGAYQTINRGGQDAFVAKLNPSGSALLYSTYLGGSGDENGWWIAVDGSGNTSVLGSTGSTNFPTTAGAYQTTNHGGVDAFVTRLNATGSALIDSTYLGGSGDDAAGGGSMALDRSGDVYAAADTNSTDLPTTAGAFQRTYGGGTDDAFVTKLNPTLSALVYSTYLGGSDNDYAFGLAVDSDGSAYVTGGTASTNFPSTAGAYQTTFGGVGAFGTGDAFVTKLNPTGSALAYSTYLGGSGDDFGDEIAVDSTGSAYVSGSTSSTNFPTTPDALQGTYGGNGDAFIAKLTPRGSLLFSTYLGSSQFDIANGIAVDGANNAYVAGSTSSTSFPVTPGAAQPTLAGNTDGYVLKLATPAYQRTTSTSVSCSPNAVLIGQGTGCTVVVTDTDAGPVSAPTGTVSFASSQSGAFAPGAACTLAATATAGQSSCSVAYTPGAVGSGAHTITAGYGGDAGHAASQGSTTVAVSVTAPVVTVTTEPASGVTTTRANLHGVINTAGLAITWQFQYGRTTRYGSGTPVQSVPAGKGTVSVAWTVRRLSPRTKYHFRVVALIGSGSAVKTVYGRDLSFTTKATGWLLLDRARLIVRHGVVSVPLRCDSSLRCTSKLSITTRARLTHAKKLATVVCATTKRFFKIRPHKRLTVRPSVRRACLTLLRNARHHRIGAKLSANPQTGQHAVIRKVMLVLLP